MVGYSESSKCQAIKQIFDDASKSELSCIIGMLGKRYVTIEWYGGLKIFMGSLKADNTQKGLFY